MSHPDPIGGFNEQDEHEDSDDELLLQMMMVTAMAAGACAKYAVSNKRPYRDDSLGGSEYVFRVVTMHNQRCIDMLRMEQHSFLNLCAQLRTGGYLKDSRHVSVEEQVAIFLMTLGQRSSNRLIADRFQHSRETISRHFNKVLKAVCAFGRGIIVPPDFNVVPPKIQNNEKYYPWFENCIGAIDGTHISANVPASQQVPYRGRKTIVTQNVMACCSFDMRFTFVYTGWEGTANDARVFMEAISGPEANFPHPPAGKYYVVDAGYANIPGYLSPYRNERYHLRDFQGGSRMRPRRGRELFNQRHSSLRNVIERCFGVLKARFPILKLMPPYPLHHQRLIVGACCILHNFMRMESQLDSIAAPFEGEDVIVHDAHPTPMATQEVDATPAARRQMAEFRDGITNRLATQFNLPY